MNIDKERLIVDAIRRAGWVSVWQLWVGTEGVSRDTIRKTLRVLEAAGLVESRKIDENRPEHEWRWIPGPCIAPSDELP